MFASATTRRREVAGAMRELTGLVQPQLQGADPDIAVIFLSSHSSGDVSALARGLRGALRPRVLFGCTAGGVIGRDEEIEDETAVSLVAARLPGVDVVPFELPITGWDSVLGDAESFAGALGAPPATRFFLVIADPFSTPIDRVLELFNESFPGIPVVGGLASAPESKNVLLLNGRAVDTGMIGVAVSGAVEGDVVVSQGCRPVGRPFEVTSARANVILSLEGEPPLRRIREMIVDLTTAERELLGNGLFIGRTVRPGKSAAVRGSFLIRGVTGVEESSGVIAIGDEIEDGEIVQFHLRDASTATEELEMMLTPQSMLGPASGALLFTCNGRGRRLYQRPNGDIATIRSLLGDVPIGGFFCAGEIGPIGGRNYLHGHTASMLLFRPERPVERVGD